MLVAATLPIGAAATPAEYLPSVLTEEDLLAAVRNDSLSAVRLPVNLRLTAGAWPAAPVVRSRPFSVVGDPFMPILDLSFLECKIQLLPGVTFTFKQVELRNTRQRAGYEVDIFSASPNATVRFEAMVFHCFSCIPIATLYQAMVSTVPNTLPQQMSWGSWCRTQPALAACYSDAVINITTASALLPVSGYQTAASSGGYTLEAEAVMFVCESPTTDECGVKQGYDFCVRNKIEDIYVHDDTWEILANAEAHGAGSGGGGGSSSHRAAVGAAIGGSIGGLLLLAAVAAALLIIRRRSRNARDITPCNPVKPPPGDVMASVQVLIAPSHSAEHGGAAAHGSSNTGLGALVNGCQAATDPVRSDFGRSRVSERTGSSCPRPAAQPPGSDAGTKDQSSVLPSYGNRISSLDGSGPRDAEGAPLTAHVASGDSTTVCVAGISIDLSNALGTGSFGKVFRGTWRRRHVAVKVLQYGSELCHAVYNEVTLSQSLRHPNVVAALYFAQVLPGGRLGLHTGGSSTASGPSSPDMPSGALPQHTHSATASAWSNANGAAIETCADAQLGPAAAGRYTRFIVSGVDSAAGADASALGLGPSFGTLGAGLLPAAGGLPGSGGSGQYLIVDCAPASAPDAAAGVPSGYEVGRAATVRSVFPLSSEAASASSPSVPPLAQASPPLLDGDKVGPCSGPAQAARGDGCEGVSRGVVDSRESDCAAARRSHPGLGAGAPDAASPPPSEAPPARASSDGAHLQGGTHTTRDATPTGDEGGAASQVALTGSQGNAVVEGTLPGLGDPQRQQDPAVAFAASSAEPPGVDLESANRRPASMASAPSRPAQADPAVAAALPAICPSASVTGVGPANTAATHTGGAQGAPTRAAARAAQPEPRRDVAGEAQPKDGVAAEPGGAVAAAGAGRAVLPLQALWLAANAQPDAGSSHGFLVMELCEGGSLGAWRSAQWREPGQLPDMAVLVRLALDIAYGMRYIHSVGVCHGDLKLANVLLAQAPPGGVAAGNAAAAAEGPSLRPELLDGWVAKLCDFGLSRVLVGDRTHVSTRPFGTPSHMAPELWTKGHVSQPGDVYAFGILLWELATGERPYRGLNAANILHAVLLNGERPPLPPWLPPSYGRLAAACWAQAPKERPPFTEIARHLEAMLVAFMAVPNK